MYSAYEKPDAAWGQRDEHQFGYGTTGHRDGAQERAKVGPPGGQAVSGTRSTLDDTDRMSPECTVARQPEYRGMHGRCRQTKDIPLPHSTGILLQARCRCACHPWIAGTP